MRESCESDLCSHPLRGRRHRVGAAGVVTESFDGSAIDAAWTKHVSPGGNIEVKDGLGDV